MSSNHPSAKNSHTSKRPAATKSSAKPKTAATRHRTKKSEPSSPTSSKRPAPKPTTQSALRLIDQGARLLRKAVLQAESGAIEGRKIVKTQGLDLVEKTSRTLQSLITTGTATVRDGLKKL